MRGSKLAPHVQGPIPSYVDDLVAAGVRYVKLMTLPDKDPWPGVRTVGRVYVEGDAGLVWDGARGADEFWRQIEPVVLSHPWVHAWEGPNEPNPVSDANYRGLLDQFTVHLARDIMLPRGLRIVGGNFSVGTPDVGHGPDFRNMLALITYLGLHEYNYPSLFAQGDAGKPWWVGRYRMLMDELRRAGCRVPPIIVGEHGIDRLLATPNNPQPSVGGWMTVNNNPAWFAGELMRADLEVYAAPEVEAVCIFTAAPYDPWGTYKLTEELARLLVPHIRANPPVDEPGPQDPKIVDLQGRLTVHPTLRYGSRKPRDIQFVVVHHSATPTSDTIPALLRIQRIADYHVNHNGWPGIGYHYIVDQAGIVYQVNHQDTVSNHTAGGNLHGLGVCLLGTYTKAPPSPVQTAAAARLIDWLGWRKVKDHHDWPGGTLCPGVAGDAVRAAISKL